MVRVLATALAVISLATLCRIYYPIRAHCGFLNSIPLGVFTRVASSVARGVRYVEPQPPSRTDPGLIYDFVRKTICENPANVSSPVTQLVNKRINQETID